ncbi:MAG: glycosyltransferase family 2 protein [Acidobacteriota bacterium]
MKVAAIIPAYQAAASVGPVVTGSREILERVVVVDDGSTDGTGEVAAAAGAEVLRHQRNLGKGRALQTAFGALFGRGCDAVVTLDADGQHLPSEIPRLLAAAEEGVGMVIGSRDHLFAQMSRLRKASNRCSSSLISILAGRRFCDIQSGFRLYSRSLIEATGFPEPRFEAESAVVVRAARLGLTVVSVPVRLGFADGRSTSHYRPLIDSLRIARAVVGARLEGARWRQRRSS